MQTLNENLCNLDPVFTHKYVFLDLVMYSLLHLECHLISISNLNLIGLFSTERGQRDIKN